MSRPDSNRKAPGTKRKPRASDAVDAFLAAHPPATRRLMEKARAKIKALVPSANEGVRTGWGLLGFSAPRYFAFLAWSKGEVRLGFDQGVLLDDDWRLLEGSGTQVRSILLRSPDDLEHQGVTALIAQAADLAGTRRPSVRLKSLLERG
jgi:hypothetical protein